MRRTGLCLALILGLTASAVSAETFKFSLPEARELAMQAAIGGRPDVALTLAGQLLAKDPDDAQAHLATSTALLAMGEWRQAYRGGRNAFRLADSKDTKFQAARVTALAAMGEDRTVMTQFWLRRAGDMAPTEVDRNRIERQFDIVRARTPYSFRFHFSATPSSNVNGGAETAYNIIDGVPLVGILSADAQALSGVVTQGSVQGSYRLTQSDRSQTFVTANAFYKSVMLSSDARAAAPTFDAGSLGVMSLDLGLSHTRALGNAGTLLSLKGGVRGYWQGDALAYSALTAGVDLQHKITPKLTFSGALAGEARAYDGGGDGNVQSAAAGLTYTFANGNRLSGFVTGALSETPSVTFDSKAMSGKISFALGEPVWNMMLSAGVGVSQTKYDDYRLGFIPVPGGRTDESVFMDIEAKFTGIEYAGFSPSLKVRRTRTDSNVGRYDTSEWAVSMGISSNF